MLSFEHNSIFELALKFINRTQRSIFISGKAGTGKTTFLKGLKSFCTKKIAIVAPTGIAAINANGVTIHSFFGLPINPFLPGISKPVLNFDSQKRKILSQLELLVIDEVSMLRADTLDAIDYALRIARKKDDPFGGVQILFIGDLYQLPPIVSDEDKKILSRYYSEFCFLYSVQLKKKPPVLLELQKVYRQNDAKFISLLNKIRIGNCSDSEINLINSRVIQRPLKGNTQIVLTTHNAKADLINKEALNAIQSQEHIFLAEITGDFDEGSYPTENSLALKNGAKVMLIRNDKGKDRKFYNGKTGTISKIQNDSIWIMFDDSSSIEIEKETWNKVEYFYNENSNIIEEQIVGTFKQFPLKLAWAITIHKSQGLTFDKTTIDLSDVFMPGQVYVALSRNRYFEGIYFTSTIDLNILNNAVKINEDVLSKLPSNISDSLFKTEQSAFIQAKLDDWLTWRNIVSIMEENLTELEHLSGFVDDIRKFNSIAQRFHREIVTICNSESEDKYSLLKQRVQAATSYFEKEINSLLSGVVKEEYSRTKSSINFKIRFRVIKSLKNCLEEKRRNILLADALISSLN